MVNKEGNISKPFNSSIKDFFAITQILLKKNKKSTNPSVLPAKKISKTNNPNDVITILKHNVFRNFFESFTAV